MTAQISEPRFRVELIDAPWVFETATESAEARAKGFEMLVDADDFGFVVRDLCDDTARRFAYDGLYVREIRAAAGSAS